MSAARFGADSAAETKLPHEMAEKYFYYRMALVEVDPRETQEEAWRRHLADHPGDIYANIKIFHRPSIQVCPGGEKVS